MKSPDMEALNSKEFVAITRNKGDRNHYGDIGKVHFCRRSDGKYKMGIEFSDGSMWTYEGDIKTSLHSPPWLCREEQVEVVCRLFDRDEGNLKQSLSYWSDLSDERLKKQYFALFGEEL
ncbi:MAG: hypothetical protein ABEK36_03240 [Candidatus Aenigmatarchaeota archaeon]